MLIICQTALQVGFDGFFEELYMDIIKRQNEYIKQIKLNLRTAFLYKETICEKISKRIFCQKMTNREMLFQRSMKTFDFENYISKIFIINNKEKEDKFKNVCNEILAYRTSITRVNRVVPIN
jgi:hypothetical protein